MTRQCFLFAMCAVNLVALLFTMNASAQENRFVFSEHGKHGYISSEGKVVIPPTLDGTYVIQFHDGRALFTEVIKPRPKKLPFVDEQGRTHIFAPQQWGYIDVFGNKVIPAKYDSAQDFSEGLAAVGLDTNRATHHDGLDSEKELHWGFIDLQGNLVIAAQFSAVSRFSEGLAAVRNTQNKWGYVDQSGHLVIPYSFDGADEFSEALAAVRVGDRWGYIDKAGKVIISPRYATAENFSEGLALVRLGGKTGNIILSRIGGRWKYIDIHGNIRINLPNDVEGARSFQAHRAAVSFGRNCGYIDSAGKLVIKPKFSSCDDFSEGLASVYNSGWQFIDPAGAVVLKLNYFQVGSFEHGLAPVTVGEAGPHQRFGYINKVGKEIWKPQPAL